MNDFNGRLFKVWDYSPSFNRLLIRSLRRIETETHVDVIFWGVKSFNLVTQLGEISIETEVKDDTYSLFRLQTKIDTYTIEAIKYTIQYSDTDLFESPLDKL